ncbi:MAG: alpha-glucosidase [Clostridia bacterium]|nr:alpha-glucosidase [Clostridia bacterium]
MKKEWWHNKVAYQIWPKSFQDSNGDGIGDIPGIISRLDDLRALGVDILWLSPVYCSPLADEGYDISDYYAVDPHFGTLEDLDRLIAEAKQRNMYLLMDLVVNHCSDEHYWFRQACADPEGPYGQFFYIEKHKPGDPMPCNWRGYFGGPVWDLLPGHEDYVYLHVFHKKQPDLNWENPQLRREVYKMINWWLDRGIAGFRIDAIINIKKVLPFRSYPADRPDGLCSVQRMLEEATGVLEFLDEMAEETFRKHDAFAIAELFDNKPEELPRFIGDKGCFSCIFDFAPEMLSKSPDGWMGAKEVTPDQWKHAVFTSQRLAKDTGFMANIIENHDEPRGVSRYIPEGERSETAKKMLGGLSFMLRGLPFLYQGQEIGMENTVFPTIDQADDCNTHGEYAAMLEAGLTPEEALAIVSRMSRDNARTPVQWTGEKNAGFTTGTPWYPINPNYRHINLEEQRQRPDSLWSFYRDLIALRRNEQWQETIVYGATEPWHEDESRLMAYYRRGPHTLLVLGNWQQEPREVQLPSVPQSILLSNLPDTQLEGASLHLRGYEFLILTLN